MKIHSASCVTNYTRVSSEEGPYDAVDGECILAVCIGEFCVYEFVSRDIYHDKDKAQAAAQTAIGKEITDEDWVGSSTYLRNDLEEARVI